MKSEVDDTGVQSGERSVARELVGDVDEQIVREWIEREIGPVLSLAREGRWRPAWFAEAKADDPDPRHRLALRHFAPRVAAH